jgi:hypothetical protein
LPVLSAELGLKLDPVRWLLGTPVEWLIGLILRLTGLE